MEITLKSYQFNAYKLAQKKNERIFDLEDKIKVDSFSITLYALLPYLDSPSPEDHHPGPRSLPLHRVNPR